MNILKQERQLRMYNYRSIQTVQLQEHRYLLFPQKLCRRFYPKQYLSCLKIQSNFQYGFRSCLLSQQSEHKKCKLYCLGKGNRNSELAFQQLTIYHLWRFNYEDLEIGFMIDTVKIQQPLKENNFLAHQHLLEFEAYHLCDGRDDQNEYITVQKEREINAANSLCKMKILEKVDKFQWQKTKNASEKKYPNQKKNQNEICKIKIKSYNYFDKLKACLKNSKKEAFNILKATIFLHQQRRELRICNCFINDDKQLSTGKEIFIFIMKQIKFELKFDQAGINLYYASFKKNNYYFIQ